MIDKALHGAFHEVVESEIGVYRVASRQQHASGALFYEP